jgi:hypothetical protein
VLDTLFFENGKNMKRDKFKVDRTDEGKKRRTFDGYLFASEMEMKYYRDHLIPLKEEGVIKRILVQPKFILQDKFKKYGRTILPINYVADFEVEYSGGKKVVVEIKGFASESAKLKRKLFDFAYPDKILEWVTLSIKDGGFISYDELQKIRAKRRRINNL